MVNRRMTCQLKQTWQHTESAHCVLIGRIYPFVSEWPSREHLMDELYDARLRRRAISSVALGGRTNQVPPPLSPLISSVALGGRTNQVPPLSPHSYPRPRPPPSPSPGSDQLNEPGYEPNDVSNVLNHKIVCTARALAERPGQMG